MLKLLIVLSAAALFAASIAQPNPAGTWLGTLEIQTIKLRVVFHIAKDGDGYKTTMDSPDQGVTGIAVEQTSFADRKLKLAAPVLTFEFEGTLSEDGQMISGEFRQAGMTFPLELKRTDKVDEPKRPQNPVPPFPYKAEDVEFENKLEGHKLAGTLTTPEGEGPFPAVVLVSGSGPQDRDEFLLGHRPFLIIADHLSRRGIAVLRYDDRGVAKSGGVFANTTSEGFTNDAVAAVDFLMGRDEIDKKKIGIAGHSEGGIIAPIAATRSPNVAFIILLAGTGVPGHDILRLQQRLIAGSAGASQELIDMQTALWDRVIAHMKTAGKDATADQIRGVVNTFCDEDEAREVLRAEWLAGVDSLLTPWLQSFLFHDPRLALRKVTVPVLALNGSLDLQVDAKQNLPEIEKALREGGNKDVTVKEFAGLNHLFQTAETGSPGEYGLIEETFAPAVLKAISDWILARFAR